jgi:hypothetical protein
MQNLYDTGTSCNKHFWREKQAKNLIHIFSITRHQKNLKTIGAYTESTYLTFRTLKKVFISWHNPFKYSWNFYIKSKSTVYTYFFQVEGHQCSTQLFFLLSLEGTKKRKGKTVIPLLEHIQLDEDTFRVRKTASFSHVVCVCCSREPLPLFRRYFLSHWGCREALTSTSSALGFVLRMIFFCTRDRRHCTALVQVPSFCVWKLMEGHRHMLY